MKQIDYHSRNKYLTKKILSDYSVWPLIILLLIIGVVVSKDFFSVFNFTILFHSGVVLGLLALASTICIITGNFDLSVEQNMIFTAMIGAYLVSSGEMATGLQLNPALTVIIMIIVGGLVGLFNGFLVGFLGINAFICTLGVSILLGGLNTYLGPAKYGFRIFPFPDSFNYIGGGKVGPIPISLLFLAVVFLIFHFILTRTVLGRSFYAVGSNDVAARSAGINSKLTICLAYVISGSICGLAGWMLMGKLSAATPAMSKGIVFYAFAAAVIGGVSLQGGAGTILGVFGGFIFISIINNVINISGLSPFLIELGSGLIILSAVIIDTLRNKFLS